MSIQIITNFNSTSKVCYVKDDNHGEAYIEGRGKDILDSAAEMAAQIIYKVAESQAEEGYPKEYKEGTKPKDAWVSTLTKEMTDCIIAKLIKLKAEEELHIDNIPESIISMMMKLAEKDMKGDEYMKGDEDNE